MVSLATIRYLTLLLSPSCLPPEGYQQIPLTFPSLDLRRRQVLRKQTVIKPVQSSSKWNSMLETGKPEEFPQRHGVFYSGDYRDASRTQGPLLRRLKSLLREFQEGSKRSKVVKTQEGLDSQVLVLGEELSKSLTTC